MSEKNPDFIIVGAPKAGTTSLHRYLEQHPKIFSPRGKKEPLFFCGYPPDFKGPGAEVVNRNMVTTPESYRALFTSAGPSAVTGEASTDYLACEEAPDRIWAWNPDARIIIMLRNPIDRAYSEHMHLVRDRFETESFMRALELEPVRRKKGYIPLFWHKERGQYCAAVQRYLQCFGENQVKIIYYDEFSDAPGDIASDVFQFLGLAPVEIDTSLKYNVSGAPRWPLIQKLYVKFRQSDDRGWVKRVARLISSGRSRQAIHSLYLRRNLRASKGITVEEREVLRNYFTEDVNNLSRLLNKNLSHWLASPE